MELGSPALQVDSLPTELCGKPPKEGGPLQFDIVLKFLTRAVRQEKEKSACVWGLKDLRYQCYPKWSTDSLQSLSESQWCFVWNRKIHPKIHEESQGSPNSQNNLKEKNNVGGLRLLNVFLFIVHFHHLGPFTLILYLSDESRHLSYPLYCGTVFSLALLSEWQKGNLENSLMCHCFGPKGPSQSVCLCLFYKCNFQGF